MGECGTAGTAQTHLIGHIADVLKMFVNHFQKHPQNIEKNGFVGCLTTFVSLVSTEKVSIRWLTKTLAMWWQQRLLAHQEQSRSTDPLTKWDVIENHPRHGFAIDVLANNLRMKSLGTWQHKHLQEMGLELYTCQFLPLRLNTRVEGAEPLVNFLEIWQMLMV